MKPQAVGRRSRLVSVEDSCGGRDRVVVKVGTEEDVLLDHKRNQLQIDEDKKTDVQRDQSRAR